ncbi:WbqC family protein [Chryseobacterium sp. DT-3]|uniref:WbqC family protein n=1 Tax=Chryseobacterium sp. DT-3 TaxID=3396164 RepID=UPI003F1C7F66
MSKILILQSNSIAWKEYFDLITISGLFVVYDDMQYTKNFVEVRNFSKETNANNFLKSKFSQNENTCNYRFR